MKASFRQVWYAALSGGDEVLMVLDDVPFAVVSLNAGWAVKTADKASETDLANHAWLVRK